LSNSINLIGFGPTEKAELAPWVGVSKSVIVQQSGEGHDWGIEDYQPLFARDYELFIGLLEIGLCRPPSKALQKQLQDAKVQAAAAETTAANAEGSDLDLKVAWKGAPQFTSADGKKFSFKIRGRVEAEYENVNQDTAITTNPDINATELRRARLGVEGVVY
jgi:hypothetical protein